MQSVFCIESNQIVLRGFVLKLKFENMINATFSMSHPGSARARPIMQTVWRRGPAAPCLQSVLTHLAAATAAAPIPPTITPLERWAQHVLFDRHVLDLVDQFLHVPVRSWYDAKMIHVRSVAWDDQQQLFWVGTEFGGVMVYDSTGKLLWGDPCTCAHVNAWCPKLRLLYTQSLCRSTLRMLRAPDPLKLPPGVQNTGQHPAVAQFPTRFHQFSSVWFHFKFLFRTMCAYFTVHPTTGHVYAYTEGQVHVCDTNGTTLLVIDDIPLRIHSSSPSGTYFHVVLLAIDADADELYVVHVSSGRVCICDATTGVYRRHMDLRIPATRYYQDMLVCTRRGRIWLACTSCQIVDMFDMAGYCCATYSANDNPLSSSLPTCREHASRCSSGRICLLQSTANRSIVAVPDHERHRILFLQWSV